MEEVSDGVVKVRWLCARLLDANENLVGAVNRYLKPLADSETVKACLTEIWNE